MTQFLAPQIVIVDVDAGIDPGEVSRVAAALTRQMLEHVSPHWGMATVRAATQTAPARDDEWRLELRRVPTIDGALGFHDTSPTGQPILYVFPELCAQDGTSWSSCASHEIIEARADPLLTWCAQLPDGRMASLEACDQVEADSYLIDGVAVSNFNLPENWAPPKMGPAKYDYLGLQTRPFEVRPGGYAQVYTAGEGWTQLGTMRPYRQKLRELGLSRGSRRE